jgi:putative transposase
VAEVCRKHGISSPTCYPWKSKYAGMSLPGLKRVKELEAENAKLKIKVNHGTTCGHL